MIRHVVALLALATWHTGLAPAAAVAQRSAAPVDAAVAGAIARFDSTIAADVAADAVGSITAALVSGNDVVWTRSFGAADPGRGISARRDHLYRVGSISKTVTAVVMLRLAEQGVLALDDPVVTYLPAFGALDGPPDQVTSITLRQLASHTGGLIREPGLPRAAAGPIEGWEDKVLASIPTTSLQSAPGTEYAYSNIGFGILGLAVSRAAGRPFRDLVHDLVFRPLGVDQDVFVIDDARRPSLAAGHAQRRDGSVDTATPALEHDGRGYKVPNGGVYASVDDLARFVAGLSGSAPVPILTPDSRREMQSVQTPEDPGSGYGLGLSIRRDGEDWFVGHGGSVAGYTAYLLLDPRSAYGVVLLRNYNRGRTNLAAAARTLLAEVTRSARRGS